MRQQRSAIIIGNALPIADVNALYQRQLPAFRIGKKMIETPARIEPCFFQDTIPSVLADLTVELQREADRLGRGLHSESAAELADLVRIMNCYYSNLIQGDNTPSKENQNAPTCAETHT